MKLRKVKSILRKSSSHLILRILDNKENHVGLYCFPTKKRQRNQRKSGVWRG